MEDEIKKEIVGGVEFEEASVLESKKEDSSVSPVKEVQQTEIAGGVEFTKTPVKNIHPHYSPTHKMGVSGSAHARTMAQDFGESIIEKQGSLLQSILKKESEEKGRKKQEQKNTILGLVGVILFIAGVGIIVYSGKDAEEIIIPQTQVVQESIVYAENHSRLDTTNKEALTILGNIHDKLSEERPGKGEITNIYFTKEAQGNIATLSARQFFSSVQSSIPADFLGTLGRNFMFGIYNKEQAGHFLIMESPRKEGLPLLMSWEVDMVREISRLFSISIPTADLYTKPFQEYAIENKSLRVLLDEEGGFILGYGYVAENTLVIVDDIETFKKVLQRLATAF